MATFYRDTNTNNLNNPSIVLSEGIYDEKNIIELKNTSYIKINPNIKVTLYHYTNNNLELYIYSNDNNANIVKTNYDANINYKTNNNINLFEYDKLNIDNVKWNDKIGKVKIETNITTEPTTTEPTTTEPTTTEPRIINQTTKGLLLTNYINNTSSSQNVFQKNQTLFIILIVLFLLFIILFILYKFNIMPFTDKNKNIIKNKFKFKNIFKK